MIGKIKNYEFTKDDIFSIIVIVLALLIIVFKPFKIAVVNGSSMEPTLHNGDIKVVLKRTPLRDDIAIFKSPSTWNDAEEKTYIKRVIAVPGDEVEITDNVIYINGKATYDLSKYYSNLKHAAFTLVDSYLVMGDNRGNSVDSIFRLNIGEAGFTVPKEYVKYSMKGK